MSAVSLKRIAAYLDRVLAIDRFEDASHNGLQVGGEQVVGRVCCGVDASLEFFEAAREKQADLLICHHGLSWGDSLKRITGLNFSRISFLLRNGMALYACHLPLDAHPRFGNNAQLCRALGLTRLKPFGMYHGREIGFEGRLSKPMRYDRFKARVSRSAGRPVQSMDFGKPMVSRVAVVSGGAAAEIEEAGRKGIDVYVSGEPALMAYSLAQEYRVNAVFAGHYATEVFGVRALAALLRRQFSLQAEFIDLGVPF